MHSKHNLSKWFLFDLNFNFLNSTCSTSEGIVKHYQENFLVSGVVCDGTTAKNDMPKDGYIYPGENPEEN